MKFFFILIIFCNMTYGATFFNKVESKTLKAKCDFDKNNDLGIFSIESFHKGNTHLFMIYKGLNYETCIDLKNQVNSLKKISRVLVIKGFSPQDGQINNVIWDFLYLKSKSSCVSYISNYCYPKDNPYRMQ